MSTTSCVVISIGGQIDTATNSITIQILVVTILDVTQASESVATVTASLDSPSSTSPGSSGVRGQTEGTTDSLTVQESVLGSSISSEALEGVRTIAVSVDLPMSTSVVAMSVGS
jgi:hypothetical protein